MCRGRKIQWDLFSKAASLVYSFRCVADVILWDGSSGLVPDPAGPSVGISAGFGTGSAWVLIRTSPRQAGRPLFAGAGDGESWNTCCLALTGVATGFDAAGSFGACSGSGSLAEVVRFESLLSCDSSSAFSSSNCCARCNSMFMSTADPTWLAEGPRSLRFVWESWRSLLVRCPACSLA